MWSEPKAVFGALLLRDYTPGRARTPKQVIGSLLIPLLTIALLMAAMGTVSFFFAVSDTFRDAIFTSGRLMLMGYVFFYPMFHGLAFRIRLKCDLRNALLSVAVYFPIFVFALGSVDISVYSAFLCHSERSEESEICACATILDSSFRSATFRMTECQHYLITLMHLMQVLSDSDTPFLAFSWFEVLLAVYFSVVVSILTLLTYRIGSAWPPAPTITAHPYYRRTETAMSLGSLMGIALILLSAS